MPCHYALTILCVFYTAQNQVPASRLARMMKVLSFNLLAHPYTKFSASFHRSPDGGVLESAAQQVTRYARNEVIISTLTPDVLCTQEHDREFVIPDYTEGVSAYVEGRSEGCSVLFRTGSELSRKPRRTWTLDLTEGKTAAFAHVPGHGVFVSVHLKGGPGSEATRRKQLAMVLQALPLEATVVICGDMNETKPDKLFAEQLALHGLRRVPYDAWSGMTSDFSAPLALDHVFVRVSAHATATVMGHPKDPWASDATCGSDHVPLLVYL